MKRSPRIEPTLLRVLNAHQGTEFTREQLLTAYRALKHEHGRNKRAAWQFIDRNLSRLTRAGIISIVENRPDHPKTYLFSHLTDQSRHPSPPNTLKVLRKKLQNQRIELLSTIGETEAYDDICTDLPDLRLTVQKSYDEARDRSLKLLGRIRVLETLIAAQSSNAL